MVRPIALIIESNKRVMISADPRLALGFATRFATERDRGLATCPV